MNQLKFEDIRSSDVLNDRYGSVVDTGVYDNSIQFIEDVSKNESYDDFLDNSEENKYQSEHLGENEEFFLSNSFQLQVSFEINSIINYGKIFTSKIMDVFLFIVKDKKLLASVIGLSGLSAILFFLLPFSYSIGAILFLCAPLSMAIIGFYKKEKRKLSYGL